MEKVKVIHRISTDKLADYVEGGLWIIGETCSGKSTILAQALNDLRSQRNTRAVIFSTDYNQNLKLRRPDDLDFESLDENGLSRWASDGSQWIWLSRTTNQEDWSNFMSSLRKGESGKVTIQKLLRVVSACQSIASKNRTVFVIDEINSLVELIYNISNSKTNIDWVITSQNMKITANPKALTKRFKNCMILKHNFTLKRELHNIFGESIYIPDLALFEAGILRDATWLDLGRNPTLKLGRRLRTWVPGE